MAFFPYSGRWRTEWYPKAASTVFTHGDLVYFNLSGAIIPADSTSGNHTGIIQKDAVSTDADYASTTSVPVLVPELGALVRCDNVDGTLTTAMVGGFYDLSNAESVNVAAQAKNVVLVKKFISATEGVFEINAMADRVNVATT